MSYPASIDPEANPGGVLVALLDGSGEIVEQSAFDNEEFEALLDVEVLDEFRPEMCVADLVVVYSGDTGELLLLVSDGGFIAFRGGSRFN